MRDRAPIAQLVHNFVQGFGLCNGFGANQNLGQSTGNGGVGYISDGVSATSTPLGNPNGVAVDAAGNLYISDTGNNRIREVNATTGIITTVVGTGAPGFAGDGGPALNAELNAPSHINFDPAGNLYIADSNNHRIRVVSGIGATASTPTITSISPTAGAVGSTITITGSNFGANQGTSTVAIGGTAATVKSWSASSISVTVASGTSSGSLLVTVGGVKSNAITFTVQTGSLSISPSTGPVGTAVAVTGTGFGATQGSSTVSFNGTPVTTYSSWSATNLLVVVPTGATTGFVTVTVAGVTETGPTFMVSGTNTSQAYSYVTPLSGGYDAAGNLLEYVDSVMGTWNFKYDNLNRLYSATESAIAVGSPDNGYTGQNLCMYYDSFGNRTQAAWQSAPCPAPTTPAPKPTVIYNANNQITNNFYTYDSAGNVTYDGSHWYAYDNEGKLCAVQSLPMSGGGMTAIGYLYDAEGRRVAKGIIPASSTTPLSSSMCSAAANNNFMLTESYIMGQSNEELTTLTWSGSTSTWTRTNVYGDGKLIGTYDSAGLHFHVTDPLGTRRTQTNAQGIAEQDCQSLPYGNSGNCYAVGTASGVNATPLFFTGKERDPQSEGGNDYFGARYYASSTGRFMSPDPSGLSFANAEYPQSLNLYSYAANNPLIFVDPTGLGCDDDLSFHQDFQAATDPTNGSLIQTDTVSGQCNSVSIPTNAGNGGQSFVQPQQQKPTAPSKSTAGCAAKFASAHSIAGGLQALGIGSHGGVGGFLTNTFGGNTFAGLYNLGSTLTSASSTDQQVLTQMGKAYLRGPLQGIPSRFVGAGGTPFASSLTGIARGGAVGAAFNAVTGANESLITLSGEVGLSTVETTAAGFATGVGEAKFALDFLTFAYGVGTCIR